MKKRYGIGFLIGMIGLILVLVCAYQFSYDRAMRKMEEKQKNVIQTEGNAKAEDGYLIKEKDGYIIVYLSDGKTVYEYTTIEVIHLPETVRQEVQKGKLVHTVGQVYGFLENYSS